MIKVSIVIPAYKVEKYIERCIQSVINQTYQGEIECIVVEDCSPEPDKSWERANSLVKQYVSENGRIKFKMIRFETNQGVSVARNVGIENATGDYLYIIDGDDYISVDCIETLVDYVNRYPNVDLVQSNFSKVYDDKNELISDHINCYKEYSDDRKWVMSNFIPRNITIGTPWNMLINLNFIRANKIYFEPGLANNQDQLWGYMIGKYIRTICMHPGVTYHYYQGNSNSAVKRFYKFKDVRHKAMLTKLNICIDNIDDYCAKSQIELLFRDILVFSAFQNNEFKRQVHNNLENYMKHLNILGRSLLWFVKITPSSILKRKIIYNSFFLKLTPKIHNYK